MVESCYTDDFVGAEPAHVRWKVVQGDTAKLTVQFYENDEVTFYNTTGWTYISTAYDPKTETSYSLDTEASPGYLTITATPETTALWGGFQKNTELNFDVQVTLDLDTIWTPIIGNILVINDVTGN